MFTVLFLPLPHDNYHIVAYRWIRKTNIHITPKYRYRHLHKLNILLGKDPNNSGKISLKSLTPAGKEPTAKEHTEKQKSEGRNKSDKGSKCNKICHNSHWKTLSTKPLEPKPRKKKKTLQNKCIRYNAIMKAQ